MKWSVSSETCLAAQAAAFADGLDADGRSGTGLTNWEKPRLSIAKSGFRPPDRGMAYDFETNENGCQEPKIRVGARRVGAALVKWTAKRAWIGSKLAADGKCQTAQRGQLAAGNSDAAIRSSTEVSPC